MMMLPLTHATLASFSASTTVAAAVVAFSPTGRSACVRKVVAPSGRYRHEPYGARVIPITGAPHIASPPLTFTPYPSVTTIRSKQQHQQQSMVVINTNSSGVYSSNESSCSSSSVSTSGHSTANSLSISSNCSRMSEVLDFFMPPVVVAAPVVVPPAPPAPTSSSSVRVLPVSATSVPVTGKSRVVDEQHQSTAVYRQQKVKTPEPEKTTVAAPTALSSSSSDRVKQSSGARFAIVAFKHETATFMAPFKLTVGDIVVVEGDRGENIGTVAEIQKDAPLFAVGAKVLRRATEKDLAALKAQREREAAATLSTRAVAESLGLHGRVEDAEYQFDLNKLTIFVSRPTKTTFVDFRKLQRTLFREFRCRIWCSYMDEIEAAEAGPRSR